MKPVVKVFLTFVETHTFDETDLKNLSIISFDSYTKKLQLLIKEQDVNEALHSGLDILIYAKERYDKSINNLESLFEYCIKLFSFPNSMC